MVFSLFYIFLDIFMIVVFPFWWQQAAQYEGNGKPGGVPCIVRWRPNALDSGIMPSGYESCTIISNGKVSPRNKRTKILDISSVRTHQNVTWDLFEWRCGREVVQKIVIGYCNWKDKAMRYMTICQKKWSATTNCKKRSILQSSNKRCVTNTKL